MFFKKYFFVILLIFLIMILYHYSDLQSNIENMTNNTNDNSSQNQFDLLSNVAKNSGLIDNLNNSIKSLTEKVNTIQSNQDLYDSKLKTITSTQQNNNNLLQQTMQLAKENKIRILQAVNESSSKANDLQNQSDNISFS